MASLRGAPHRNALRRVLALAAMAAALTVAVPAAAAASAAPNTAAGTQPSQSQPLPAQLGKFACRLAQNPLNRLIEVTATMRPVSGTERMAMRFQLQQQLPWETYHQIYGGDLDRWRYPSPPTFGQQPGDTWIVNKPVANLRAPARYRFKVTFKWVTWSGQVTTATRFSSVCREPA